MKLIIKNGRIIDPKSKRNEIIDILIDNGVIQAIEHNIVDPCAEVIDAKDMIIVPGFIDIHSHIGEPGYEHNETIETASKSAAKGGFTSILAMPTTKPAIDNKTVVEFILSRSKSNDGVQIYPAGSITLENAGTQLTEIAELKFSGILALSDGNEPIMNADVLYKALQYSKMFDFPVITLCSDSTLTSKGVMNEGICSTILGLSGMPKAAEEIMVARNLILAEHTKAHIHITQVSTKGSVELIRSAKRKGVKVTADTSPHYFSLTEDHVIGYNSLAKVFPPLRTAEDTEAIIQGLMDDTIDVITSGHTPVEEEKKNTDFGQASFGVSSLETVFPIAYKYLVKTNKLSYEKLFQKLSKAPADILGLNKGSIEVKAFADLTIIDPNEKYTIDGSLFSSRAKHSIFDKEEVEGKVRYTIVKGKIIMDSEASL